MQRARKTQQKQAIQDIPLTRAKNTLMKETQAMSETTDTDNQKQKDNISSDEEFETKRREKENLSQLIKAIFNSVMIISLSQ